MTELATPPAEESTGVKRISHWIGGRTVAGESGRSGVVFNPATGRQTGAVDFATVEEVDRAVQAAKEAFPAWRAVSLGRRAEIFFRIRELVAARREEVAKLLTAEHGKVLSDAVGEVTRGLEVIEFCCGIPTLLEERVLGAGVDGDRRLLDPSAARRRRRHHAVQLPGDGARCGCGRPRSRAATRSCSSRRRRIRRPRSGPRSCSQEAGVPDGVFNVVHRRQGRSRRGARASRHRRRLVRRLDADRALRLRDGDVDREALPGTRRREEPHDRPARRRHRHGRGCGGVGRVRLRRRALHGDLAGGRRRRRRRAADRGDQGADPEGEGRRRDGSRPRRWARS